MTGDDRRNGGRRDVATAATTAKSRLPSAGDCSRRRPEVGDCRNMAAGLRRSRIVLSACCAGLRIRVLTPAALLNRLPKVVSRQMTDARPTLTEAHALRGIRDRL